jgi:hypothetical protein
LPEEQVRHSQDGGLSHRFVYLIMMTVFGWLLMLCRSQAWQRLRDHGAPSSGGGDAASGHLAEAGLGVVLSAGRYWRCWLGCCGMCFGSVENHLYARRAR